MRRISSIALVGMLAVVTGGCGVFTEGEEQSTTSSPIAEAPTSAPSPSPTVSQTPATSQEQPTVEKPIEVATASELIHSTNPEQRVRELEKEGNQKEDPFNVLTLTPIVERTVDSAPPKPGSTPPKPGPTPPNNGDSVDNRTDDGDDLRPDATVAIAPLAVPEIPTLEPPPTLGQLPIAISPAVAYSGPPPISPPNTARAIEVTGVIQLSSGAKAIVKAPNEQSRYVGEGDRLANGAVLVKHIKTNLSADPVVILEENGTEVSRVVGSEALPPLDPPTVPSAATNGSDRTIDGLQVSSLRLRGATLVGRVTNVSSTPVRVSTLTLRLEEKGTGTLVNTVTVRGPDGELAPNQAGFIQSAGVNAFGLSADELTVKFENWQ